MNIGSINSFRAIPRFGDTPPKKSLKDYTKEELKFLSKEELNRLIDEAWEASPDFTDGR